MVSVADSRRGEGFVDRGRHIANEVRSVRGSVRNQRLWRSQAAFFCYEQLMDLVAGEPHIVVVIYPECFRQDVNYRLKQYFAFSYGEGSMSVSCHRGRDSDRAESSEPDDARRREIDCCPVPCCSEGGVRRTGP